MADLYLDPLTGDLVVTDDVRFTTGLETLRQLIELRITATKGECIRDLDKGIDYFGEILGQKPDTAKLTAIFRKVLIETPGVDRVTTLTVTYTGTTREITVDWEGKAGTDVISGSLDL